MNYFTHQTLLSLFTKQQYHRISLILLYSFIFLLPSQLGKHFFFEFSFLSGVRIDYLAPTLYFTDILALILIVLNIKTVWLFFRQKTFLILFTFLSFNILFSLSPWISVYKVIKVIEMLAVFAIIKHERLSPRYILQALLLGSAMELVLIVLQFVTKQSMQGIFYLFGERYFTLSTPGIAKASLQGIEFLRPYGTFSHPNSMGGFYLLLYFFIFTWQTAEKYVRLRTLLLFISTILIFFSFSKIAIGTFLILNITYLILKRKEIGCKLCIAARIGILTILAVIFASAHGDPLSGGKRLDLMKDAFTIFSQYPIFGVGLGNYLVAQNQFPIKYAYFFLQPVHNIFLLLLAEGGIITTGVITYLITPWVKNMLKIKVFWYTMGVILITGMFDHYWFTLQQNILLMPVVFALLNKENV